MFEAISWLEKWVNLSLSSAKLVEVVKGEKECRYEYKVNDCTMIHI